MNAVLIFAALQAALGAALVALFALQWGYPLQAAAWHALFLLFWAGAWALLAWPWRARRWALALIFAACALPPPLLYLGQWVSHRAWGGHLNAWVLARFVPQLPSVLRGQGLEPGALALNLLALLGLGLALGWSAAPALAQGLSRLRARAPRWVGAWLGLGAGLGLALATGFNGQGSSRFSGEPFSSLALGHAMTMNPARLAAARADQALRAAYSAGPKRRANVIFVVLDALRADRVHGLGYPRATTPFLDGLLKDPRCWSARALAAAPNTNESVMALLASREAPRLGPGLFKLNEILSDLGWRCRAIIGSDADWQGLRRLLGAWDQVSDGALGGGRWSTDDRILLRHLEALPDPQGRPELVYLHLYSTHTLGHKDPAFARWQPALQDVRWQDFIAGAVDRERAGNRYDNGVLQADAMLQRAWRILEAQGRLEDAIVVVSADHGEALGEEGGFGHSLTLERGVLEVPLLIWDSRGRCCPAPASLPSHLDVAPTVLRALGLPAPSNWQGHPLQAPLPPRQLYVETPTPRPWRALFFQHQGAWWRYQTRGHSREDADAARLLPWDPGLKAPPPEALRPQLDAALWQAARR